MVLGSLHVQNWLWHSWLLLYGIDDQVIILAMAISNWECLLVIAVWSEHGASSSTS
jgi:hypothetical protein